MKKKKSDKKLKKPRFKIGNHVSVDKKFLPENEPNSFIIKELFEPCNICRVENTLSKKEWWFKQSVLILRTQNYYVYAEPVYTCAAAFRFQNGEEVEIPSPGGKWELENRTEHTWPARHVELSGDIFGLNWFHRFSGEILHTKGKRVWHKYWKRIGDEKAQVLWVELYKLRKKTKVVLIKKRAKK